jgi:hypothetical protein
MEYGVPYDKECSTILDKNIIFFHFSTKQFCIVKSFLFVTAF